MCHETAETGVEGALAMLDRALDTLTRVEASSLPAPVQARALRELERAEAKHTAARAGLLTAFTSGDGYQADGQGSPRTWLRWQTRVTKGAAAAAVAWVRRLAEHPVVADALATGAISASWAREICGWSDQLPEETRAAADTILTAAARSSADLADLASLAQEMYERSRRDTPDTDPDDGFDDRYFRLGLTFRGAGRAEGDLTPGCAAALSAVLDALGRKAGQQDTRTAAQRRHDALEEACRRLITAGMLPGRAGQPAQIQIHMSLAQLRAMPGAAAAEAAWIAARSGQPGLLTGRAAHAATCDATVIPVVTGHLDPAALDQMVQLFLDPWCLSGPPGTVSPGEELDPLPGEKLDPMPGEELDPMPGEELDPLPGEKLAGPSAGVGATPSGRSHPARSGPAAVTTDPPAIASAPCACVCGQCDCPRRQPLPRATRERLRGALLALAIEALSGPGGLAATLRGNLSGTPPADARVGSRSLPLDIGAATETIPAHLRRAVAVRHPHCAFPGCDQPGSVCDIHHLVPRAEGGRTALPNLVPLCAFHHLIVIHQWGWTLRLNPDGSTTATSPDGRAYHSNAPPGQAA